ncbi:MAG: class I SAM-dependent methyltransferase [Actinomycetota bacterium]
MSEWDEHAADWERDAGPRAYAEAAFGSLLDVLDGHGIEPAGARVCDFGCGTGLLVERLVTAGASVDGVDTSTAMLDLLREKIERHGWSTVRALEHLASAVGPYDVVVCSSVLSFVDDHPGTVQRLATLLRPGGTFVQWDWERAVDADDDHGLTAEEISTALVAAGLVDVEVGTGFEVAIEDQVMRPLRGTGRRSENVADL